MVWFSHLVWPSVCGWKAVDVRGRIPESIKNSCHTAAVKSESRSDTISDGSQWWRHTSRAKVLARSHAPPPHKGVPGNEKADEWVKIAAEKP